MLNEFQNYLTFENIYLVSNLGVLPFWFMLLFIPNSKTTQILVNSIIVPLLLAAAYCYVFYKSILIGDNFFLQSFKIYSGLDGIYTMFSTEHFLLLFWLHFLALNLFLGSWIAKDASKGGVPRALSLIPLIVTYFSGPVGLVIYWILRIFYAKKIIIHE